MKNQSSAIRRRGKPVTVAPLEAPAPPVGASFPAIGIGASAGGLGALGHFLARIPKESGMALVIVRHFDPTRK
jgi:two-component system CheB/CheR fusion protein